MADNFLKENWPHILTVVIVFLTLIVTFQIMGVNFSPYKDKQVQKIVTVETFDTKPSLDPVPSNHNNDLHKIHKTCKSLSKNACSNASYCVLLNNSTCVGGNKHGPTYLTDNGKNVDFDYYHHKNTCRGKCS